MTILRKKIKIFISHASQDDDELQKLVEWLRNNDCEPVYDKEYINGGDSIDLNVRSLIDNCNGFIAMGTLNYMSSKKWWCKAEVDYACTKMKPYLPILVQPIEGEEIKDWFKRSNPGDKDGVRYLNCYDNKFDSIKPFLRGLTNKTPITPFMAVLLGIFFLIIIPMIFSFLIRESIGKADREIREVQRWIEELNQRIDHGNVSQSLDSSCSEDIIYHDRGGIEIVARDIFVNSKIKQRLFFWNRQEVGKDEIEIGVDSQSSQPLRKTREIYIHGKEGLIVEEMFDSVGNLISKRVKYPRYEKWRRYTDIGSSLYPYVLTCGTFYR